jgi:broad-specificity NMP kinase
MKENLKDLHQILVFLPVGVPGMGKTTLGRYLESAASNVNIVMDNGRFLKANFTRVSYDIVFSTLQAEYMKQNPEADFIAAFDIIRPKADEVFLR